MKKISFVMVCALVVMLLAGCTTVVPGGLGSGELGGKVGEASAKIIFRFPLNNDAGIMGAAANGTITEVTAWDVKTFIIFPFYMERTTVVTGN